MVGYESILVILEIITRTMNMSGYAVNTGITVYTCYHWARARTQAEIEQARKQSITGMAIMGLIAGIAATISALMVGAYELETRFPTFIRTIPAYIMVLAIFAARDPLAHNITWGASLLGFMLIISAVLTPGGAETRIAAIMATCILGSHTAIILNGRACRQGPAQAITSENAATLLGMDAGAEAYLLFLMSSW